MGISWQDSKRQITEHRFFFAFLKLSELHHQGINLTYGFKNQLLKLRAKAKVTLFFKSYYNTAIKGLRIFYIPAEKKVYSILSTTVKLFKLFQFNFYPKH